MRGQPTNQMEAARALGLGDEDLRAWERSGLPPAEFDDWLIDRAARRPAGLRAREVYGHDEVHDFARRAILGALELGRDDHLLDVGCGGGILLRDALATGAKVTGVDHSAEMVRLARERAPGAEVLLATAEELPLTDESFSAVSLSIVLMFLEDPVAALRECRRVLVRGGRIAAYTSSPALRGTPAAPEPLASHAHFYDDRELATLATRAGFADVHVANDGGGQLLTGTK